MLTVQTHGPVMCWQMDDCSPKIAHTFTLDSGASIQIFPWVLFILENVWCLFCGSTIAHNKKLFYEDLCTDLFSKISDNINSNFQDCFLLKTLLGLKTAEELSFQSKTVTYWCFSRRSEASHPYHHMTFSPDPVLTLRHQRNVVVDSICCRSEAQ